MIDLSEELASALDQLDEANARLTAALDSLAALCRIQSRTGGYMTPDEQIALRQAQAVLAENGRTKGHQ